MSLQERFSSRGLLMESRATPALQDTTNAPLQRSEKQVVRGGRVMPATAVGSLHEDPELYSKGDNQGGHLPQALQTARPTGSIHVGPADGTASPFCTKAALRRRKRNANCLLGEPTGKPHCCPCPAMFHPHHAAHRDVLQQQHLQWPRANLTQRTPCDTPSCIENQSTGGRGT